MASPADDARRKHNGVGGSRTDFTVGPVVSEEPLRQVIASAARERQRDAAAASSVHRPAHVAWPETSSLRAHPAFAVTPQLFRAAQTSPSGSEALPQIKPRGRRLGSPYLLNKWF